MPIDGYDIAGGEIVCDIIAVDYPPALQGKAE